MILSELTNNTTVLAVVTTKNTAVSAIVKKAPVTEESRTRPMAAVRKISTILNVHPSSVSVVQNMDSR